MIRAIIFDCFGVLLTDSLQLLREEVSRKNPEVAAEITDIIAANNHGLIAPNESNKQIASLLGISVTALKERVAGREVRDEKLLAYIEELHKNYKTALLSNIAGSSLQQRFPGNELNRYFDIVVASSDIGYAKPEPESYMIVAERLGVDPRECIFTDDRTSFCEGARSVGMRTIEYVHFSQFKEDLERLLTRESA